MKKRILFTAAALVCAANLTAQCLGVGSSTSSMSPEEMAAAAKAEREKEARIVLAEVEKDVAEMLLDATKVYRQDEMAFELRSMHLLSEGVKESNGTLVIPSAYSEGFKRNGDAGQDVDR